MVGALQIIYPRKGIANVSKEVFFKGPFLVMNERAARADDLLPNPWEEFPLPLFFWHQRPHMS